MVDNRTGERREIEVTRVVAALGLHANLGPVADRPITLQGRQLPVNRRMETEVPGVFAAGDITTYDGKLRRGRPPPTTGLASPSPPDAGGWCRRPELRPATTRRSQGPARRTNT